MGGGEGRVGLVGLPTTSFSLQQTLGNKGQGLVIGKTP